MKTQTISSLFINEEYIWDDDICSECKCLDFSNKQLTDDKLDKVIKLVMALSLLEELILDFNLITKFGLKQLLIGLSGHPKLRKLSLRGNRIDEQNKKFFIDNYIKDNAVRELLYRENAYEDSKEEEEIEERGLKIDLSFNLMTSALSDTALSGGHKKLLYALLAILITLNKSLTKIRTNKIKLKTMTTDEKGMVQLEFTRKKGNDKEIPKEIRILKGNKERLNDYRQSKSCKNWLLEVSEISGDLLGKDFENALEIYPELRDVNLREIKDISTQKAIAKQLLGCYNDAPLKYLLSHHPIFHHTEISNDIELPSLLMPEFSVSTDRWIVYLMIKKTASHASLAWEGLYKHGQRCFERAHLTAEIPDKNFIGHVLDEARLLVTDSGREARITNHPPALKQGGLSKNPSWFEHAREAYDIIPVYATKEQIKNMVKEVRNEINGMDANYLHRLSITGVSNSTKKGGEKQETVQNCITWAEDKINRFLELPPAHQITGTGVTKGNLYDTRTHEQALQEFQKRNKALGTPTEVAHSSRNKTPSDDVILRTGVAGAGIAGVANWFKNKYTRQMDSELILYAEQVDIQLLNPGVTFNQTIHQSFSSTIEALAFKQKWAIRATAFFGFVAAAGLVYFCHSRYSDQRVSKPNTADELSDSSICLRQGGGNPR